MATGIVKWFNDAKKLSGKTISIRIKDFDNKLRDVIQNGYK